MTSARLRDRRAAVALAWASVAFPAALASLPIAGSIGARFGDRADGDVSLFAPGGGPLLETLRLSSHELVGAAVAAPWLALAYAWCVLVPWACLTLALSSPTPAPLGGFVGAAVARVPTLTFLLGLGLAARALLLALGGAVASALAATSSNERTSTLLSGAGFAMTFALLSGVRVLHDLASAAACRHGTRGTVAALHAVATLAHAPGALLARWGALALARLGLLAAAALITARVGVATGPLLALVFLVHQATLVGLVLLRAAWLRYAIAAIGGDDPSERASRGQLAGEHQRT